MVTGMQGRAEMPELKILLGGIPLGCDNIGDEAILGCFTSLVRRLAPRAEHRLHGRRRKIPPRCSA